VCEVGGTFFRACRVDPYERNGGWLVNYRCLEWHVCMDNSIYSLGWAWGRRSWLQWWCVDEWVGQWSVSTGKYIHRSRETLTDTLSMVNSTTQTPTMRPSSTQMCRSYRRAHYVHTKQTDTQPSRLPPLSVHLTTSFLYPQPYTSLYFSKIRTSSSMTSSCTQATSSSVMGFPLCRYCRVSISRPTT